jgi:hypothetical protein
VRLHIALSSELIPICADSLDEDSLSLRESSGARSELPPDSYSLSLKESSGAHAENLDFMRFFADLAPRDELD